MSDGRIGELAAEARELETAAHRLVTAAPPAAADLRAARAIAERLASGCLGAAVDEAALAAACTACLRGLETGDIPVGDVLMYLASASASLAYALAERADGREPDPRPLAAARHEIESFTPSAEARRAAAAPDVPLTSLRRREPT